jgi:hypothetical protein
VGHQSQRRPGLGPARRRSALRAASSSRSRTATSTASRRTTARS